MNANKSLSILHIAPTPFFADRGCHMRIAGIVAGLNKDGHRNLVCTYHLGRDVAGIHTARTLPIPGYTKTTAGYSPFKYVADILLVFMVIWKVWVQRPDVIHGHLHEGVLLGFVAKLCCFWRRTPLVFDVQGSLVGELVAYGKIEKGTFAYRVFYLIEKCICYLPQQFMCSSKHSVEILVDEFDVAADKVMLTADGTDVSKFDCKRDDELKARLGLPVDTKIIVFSGSLLPAKGIEELKSLVMASVNDPIHFFVIGYPEEAFSQWVVDQQQSHRVTITGRLDFDKLPSYLALADIGVEPKLASAGEASGKLINYMAASLPVVCFESTVNRELLDGNGLFATGDDLYPALCDALGLTTQALQASGAANRQRILDNYTWDATVYKMVASYRSLLARQ